MNLWRTAFVLVLGTFMATLDSTIVSVGVETLAQRFDASVTEVNGSPRRICSPW